jgi:hypothetical protein
MAAVVTLPIPTCPNLHIRYGLPALEATLREASASPQEMQEAREGVLASAIDVVLVEENGALVSLGKALGGDGDIRTFAELAEVLSLDVSGEHAAIAALLPGPRAAAHTHAISAAMQEDMPAVEQWIKQEALEGSE